ncbi:MAG TPA: hypothetical protein VLQ93_09520 [Myxococcaceae bacterium]|nr:hypothetical protein [Myxococcaceae bacterium]
MSIYQSYEFQAVERPLSSVEKGELRQLCARPSVSSFRFSTVVTEPDGFLGDPDFLVDRLFDGFVLLSNTGTREFQVRLPRRFLEPSHVRPYETMVSLCARTAGENLVLTFRVDSAALSSTEGEGWLAALLPLRDELMAGDLRALYIGWLVGARAGQLDEDEKEPPVPPGLGQLSMTLEALVELLGLDKDLLAGAAESSAPLPTPEELTAWLSSLPVADKDALLLSALSNPHPLSRVELLRRFRQQQSGQAPQPSPARRTVSQLREAGMEQRSARERRQFDQLAQVRARELRSLAEREPQAWREVESLLATRKPMSHARGVQLLVDLRDLALLRGNMDGFQRRLDRLRAENARRRNLLSRMNAALGLR